MQTEFQEFKPNWFKLTNGWYWVLIHKNASSSIKLHRIDYAWQLVPGKPKVAVIRDPYDRAVSCWLNRKDDFKANTFEEFIREIAETPDELINSHARAQHTYLNPFPDLLIDFKYVNEGFKKIGLELKHTNRSDRKHCKVHYTDELKELIKMRYRQDFELYETVMGAP